MPDHDITPPGGGQPDQARLLVNGRDYGGWLSFTIARTMEAPSGTFELAVSDAWPGGGAPWPLKEGDECQLNVGDEPLVSGHIDVVRYSLSGESRDLTVSGRDKAADLVDCSYVEKPDQWRRGKVGEIAAALARPFGVATAMAVPDSEVENFKVEPGETAYDALERLLKLKGLYAWPDGSGGLAIGSSGFPSLGVVLAQSSCVSLSASRDGADRFSQYLVKGQRPTLKAGADPGQGRAASQMADRATDPDVRRYRPLLIVSEGSGAEAAERALWEAAVRAGKALQAEAVVQGYRPAPKAPIWALGKTVKVEAPGIGLDAELLISGVKLDLQEGSGRTTTLTLSRPDAWLPEPVKEGQGGGGLPPGTIIYS